jgi:N-acetylneuraminic acid mutarotase
MPCNLSGKASTKNKASHFIIISQGPFNFFLVFARLILCKTKIMRRNFILCCILCSLVAINSCKKNCCTQTYSWQLISDFPANSNGRYDAVDFVIGNYAYMATGLDCNFNRFNDLWQFDPVKQVWTQQASLPAAGRNAAVAMAIGPYGYIGAGYDGTNLLNDFWQYDPSTNLWTRKADFAGGPRYLAVAFGIGDYGYITTGYDTSSLNDCWQYDPNNDSWTQRANFGGTPRSGAVDFVYNNQAYVVTGSNNYGELVSDFWKFDPSKQDPQAWTRLRDIAYDSLATYLPLSASIMRTNAVAFVILGNKSNGNSDKAYLSTGEGNNGLDTLYRSTWSYSFSQDKWQSAIPFPGVGRQGAIGFSVQNLGFIGFGYGGTSCLSDIYEYYSP